MSQAKRNPTETRTPKRTNEFGRAQQTQPSIHAIMSRIRSKLSREGEPQNVTEKEASRTLSFPAVQSPDLEYLHRRHSYALESLSSTADSGLWSRFVSRMRRVIVRLLLGNYLQEEQEFQAHLVRYLELLGRLGDLRRESISSRMDEDLRALEIQLLEKVDELERRSVTKNSQNEVAVAELSERFKVLEGVAKGLERMMALFPAPQPELAAVTATSDKAIARDDVRYVLLENRYRGSEDEIAQRLRRYVNIFSERLEGEVLEIGAGRGELQQLFRESGIASFGCEMNRAMAELAQQKDLPVKHEDAFALLAALPDDSLAGIVAIQVVEHLGSKQLERLLELSRTKLKLGGKLVFETINTESLLALCHNYFRDPTHAWPLHPDTMKLLLEMHGMKVQSLEKLSAFPESVKLHGVENLSALAPSMQEFAQRFNALVGQLNALLYGYQDYCVVSVRER